MHFIRSLTSLAACMALSLPIQAAVLKTQDMMTMQEAFDHIFTQLDRMTASLGSNTADEAGVVQMTSENAKLRDVIAVGTQKIKTSPSIAFMDLINIGGPLFVMENKVAEWMEVLTTKKASIEKAGASKAILEELKKDREGVNSLVAAIGQNLPIPALLGMIATPIGNAIVNKLDASIKEWTPKSA
jgi:hypothetical protein